MDYNLENPEVAELLELHRHKIRNIGAQHGVIARIKGIISNKKPNPEKLFVAEGIWAHMKIMELNIPARFFLFCPSCVRSPEAVKIVREMLELTDEAYAVSEKVFASISERDRIDGLLSVCAMPVYDPDAIPLPDNAVIVVLDGLEIPGNVGTITRTCDGANIDAIFLCNRRVRLSHPKLIKGSMGAAFSVPFVEFGSPSLCMEWLEERGFSIYMADTRADKFYYEYKYTHRTALIVGSERYGISREWYSPRAKLLSIPMLGVCDSLNVGVAASIILYDMSVKLGKSRTS